MNLSKKQQEAQRRREETERQFAHLVHVARLGEAVYAAYLRVESDGREIFILPLGEGRRATVKGLAETFERLNKVIADLGPDDAILVRALDENTESKD